MKVEIFNVEHGQCALVTTFNGGHILIDCGTNTTTGWNPTQELLNRGISSLDELIITNCDEDHASDLAYLKANISIDVLTRNPTIDQTRLYQQKSLHGMGRGIATLSEMMSIYDQPVGNNPRISDIYFSSYYNKFGEFYDENSLSLVVFFTIGSVKFCFNGDMTSKGWHALLANPNFVAELPSVTVFMASHHGRRDGCCSELYSIGGLDPLLTVISDSGIQHATQETVEWYRNRSIGCDFGVHTRKVLTTRSDGSILFLANSSGGMSVSFF